MSGNLSKRERRRRQRRNALIVKCVILAALVVALIFAIKFVVGMGQNDGDQTADTSVISGSQTETDNQGSTEGQTSSQTPESTETSSAADSTETIIAQARTMATQYDFDGAAELLYAVPNYEENPEIVSLIADIETQKSNLVEWTPYDITHVFFHSLVVDPARGFSLTGDSGWDSGTAGFCQWMTTVDEFNSIINQMYERGYVIVSLYDMVEETVDESGYTHMSAKNIYLPQGKTPFVISFDDLSYYHSYDGRGCASKMIIGEDGKPTCEYIDANGVTQVGDYDYVPILDKFLEEHPDFSYKGAKGTIALTGYNGILGYRTDYCYRDRVELDADQEAWLAAHPDFNWDEECANAKAVADCLKADGWTFASHTWGHIHIGEVDMQRLQTDTEKWLQYVEPLVGDVDIIIFAHGQDLAAWNEDYGSAEKFTYLKSQGFNIYCNVDSSKYFVQLEDGFLRMGRRNLDGYRLWWAVYGDNDKTEDLYDSSIAIDPLRPTDQSLYEL